MLPIELVNKIDQMIHEGVLSHRKIAEKLGVGRSIVNSIASGRRGLYGHDPLENCKPLAHTTPPTRCPDCGYRVYLPCLVCQTREHRHRQLILGLLARTHRRDKCARLRDAG